MKRIIDMSGAYLCHKGSSIGMLVDTIRKHFKLKSGHNYEITIIEGKKYIFKIHEGSMSMYYDVYRKCFLFNDYVGLVCKEEFDNLFFVPDLKKRYDITVKKVKK